MTRLAVAATIFAAGLTGLLTNRPDLPVVLPSAAGPVKHRPAPSVRASRSMRRLPLPWTSHRSTPAVKARHRHHAASHVLRAEQPAAATTSAAHDWTGVAQCESGGNWSINTGNGYYGGLQEDLTFWQTYGGLAYAARPDLASEPAQITVAERGLAAQGAGAWPICGARLVAS